jgi:hypothetical protein
MNMKAHVPLNLRHQIESELEFEAQRALANALKEITQLSAIIDTRLAVYARAFHQRDRVNARKGVMDAIAMHRESIDALMHKLDTRPEETLRLTRG